MSDSSDEAVAERPRKKQKRFTFKRFSQRVDEVEAPAAVYRSLAPVTAAPAAGAASFTQEALQHWRESCSGPHFQAAAAVLTPLTQTLPQLLHHQAAVADAILRAVSWEAEVSLEASLALVQALARDLQADFLPHLPRAMSAVADVLDEGGERQPEVAGQVFACAAGVCRALARPLAADPPRLLAATARLRYAHAEYVRRLAAQAFGPVLRRASPDAVRASVRALLAEHAGRPSEARTQGAGWLLAEAAAGVANGLHSRAPLLLATLLAEDALPISALRGASGRAPALSREALRECAAAVAGAAVARLLELGRRGGLAPLWRALLDEAEARLARCERAAASGVGCAASAARAVGLVAQAVEFHRGSRVKSYEPLITLATRLSPGPMPYPSAARALRTEGLSLLVEACAVLQRGHASAGGGTPLLLAARPNGERLAARALRALAGMLRSRDDAALRALAADALDLAARRGGGSAHAAMAAAEVVASARDWAGLALSAEQLQAILPALEPALAARSQAHRSAALRILCAFPQPALTQAPPPPPPPLPPPPPPPPPISAAADDQEGEEGDGDNGEGSLVGGSSTAGGASEATAPADPSDVFPGLARLEGATCSVENGRSAAVAVAGLGSALAAGRVPGMQLAPLVRSLLGLLHIRFSMLWAPISGALGAALGAAPAIAWPLVLCALQDTQAAFLSGQGGGEAGVWEEDEDEGGAAVANGGGLEEQYARAHRRGSAAASGGCTDAGVRLGSLLNALAAAPVPAVEARAREWAPVFLAYADSRRNAADAADDDAEPDAGGSAGASAGAAPPVAAASRVGGRAWRQHMRGWLAVLGRLPGLRGAPAAAAVRAAVARQLLDMDAAVQQAALKCLKGFRLRYLGAHLDRLLRLADDATLRVELASFPLAAGAEGGIAAEHRADLLAVLVRLLWPKMRKRSGRLGGKGAPGSARAAILNFLAALELPELRTLLVLFLAPLEPPADSAAVGAVDQRVDQRVAESGGREVRGAALRLLAELWARFPDGADWAPLWQRFFTAVAPLAARLPAEALGDRAPALLEVVGTLAASRNLAPLLADAPSVRGEPAAFPAARGPGEWAAEQHLGTRLMQAALAALVVPRCSESTRRAVLGVLESILDAGEDYADAILRPHTSTLLDSLRQLVAAAAAEGSGGGSGGGRRKRSAAAQKRVQAGPSRGDALRALAVLERLAGGANAADAAVAAQLTEALLPMLGGGGGGGRGRAKGAAGEAAALRALGVLAALWAQLAAAPGAGSIPVEDLWRYAGRLAPLAGSLGEREARTALGAATQALAALLPELALPARLLAALNTMSGTMVDEPDYESRLGAYAELTGATWAALGPARALPLLHHLAVRQEHLALLRQLVTALPARFPDLAALEGADPETDPLVNLAHLQLHRRTRALARLSQAVAADELRPATLLGVIVPLLQQMIIEGKAAEGGGHELKELDRDREANVVTAAIAALAATAGALAWPHYQQLLGRFMRIMGRDAGKAVIRAVCAIIDAFHFPLPDDAAADRAALVKRVLPALQAQLLHRGGEAVRAPVALALVKLLRHLPAPAARAALPRALQGVANLLRARLQRIRDDARTVLVAMVAELGSEYLPFAITVLRSALPSKGYMGHVLGFTLHAILAVLVQGAEPGALDDVMEDVLPAVAAEVWGDVGEEKEAGAFAGGCKEAKHVRAFGTYQLLAAGTTFRTHFGPLLRLVRERLGEASAPKVRGQLAALLQAALRGAAANPTATADDVAVFVYATLEGGLAAEEAAAAAAAAAAEVAGQGQGDGGSNACGPARHQHLLVELALGLLLRALRKGPLAGRSPGVLARLDPLLPLLVRALRCRAAAVAQAALRALALLVPLPLPGLAGAAPGAGAAMMELLRGAPDTGAPLPQDCLRLLAALLRACSTYRPSTGQLRFLLGWAYADAAAAAARPAAFGLLRAVLARRLVLPEVYDLMARVQSAMVQAQSAGVRQACGAALLAFLLDYPLGAARLRHHRDFLIANLAYEHDDGRLAVLDMLQAALAKFPDAVVEEWAPMLFLPLVTRLVNDPVAGVRAAVGHTLRALLQRASGDTRERLAAFCERWLAGGDARLRRAAAQALGLLAAVEGTRVARRVPALLPPLLHALQPPADHAQPEGAVGSEAAADGVAAGWQECYYSLLLVEKLHAHAPAELHWEASADARALWASLPALLLHRHAWVRRAAARLLGLGFADEGVAAGLLAAAGPGRLALLCYQQVEAEGAEDALLTQATKNLVFLAPHLYEVDLYAGRVPPVAAAPTSAHDAAALDTANIEPGSPARSELEQNGDGSDREAENDGGGEPGSGSWSGLDPGLGSGTLSLHGLVRRMARLADDRTWPAQRARLAALRFGAALAARLGRGRVEPYLPTLLRPLYRITEGAAASPDEVKALAAEVVAHLRTVAGPEALLAAYNAARRGVAEARVERRRQRTLQALADPEAAAAGRLRKQARRAAGRKRQREELARQRAAGLVVKNKRLRAAKGAHGLAE
ncbi:hypothetical protein WJX81_002986 [Elliptochloris bilobata]|uniref:BP28 C-terminal domain-containing protein n=1 Tax=Elliptochloris bilobata TaxID=381761 RepID=A0AAW1SIC7_9CHLO